VGTGALSLGARWSKREAEHSPSPNAEVKYERECTSPHHILLHGLHRDSLSPSCGQIVGFVVLVGMVRLTATECKGLKCFSQAFACVAVMRHGREWNSLTSNSYLNVPIGLLVARGRSLLIGIDCTFLYFFLL
jgi:hypothetical protein